MNPQPIPSQRHLFDLPDDAAYLNCAYVAPLPRAAREAGAAALDRRSRPWEIRAPDFFGPCEELRALFGRLIGAGADDVAITPAASYGIAVAAANLPLAPGQRVLLLGGALDLEEGRYERAIEKLRNLVNAQPMNLTARKLLATALLRSDASKNGIELLLPVVARGDADAYALTLLRWGGFAGIDPQTLPATWTLVQRFAALPAVARAIERERLELNVYKS